MTKGGPAYLPIEIYGNDSCVTRLEFVRVVNRVEVPLDVTGRTYLAEVRASADRDSALLAVLDVDIVDAAGGIVTVTVPPEAQRGGPPGAQRGLTGYWDLQETVNGQVQTILAGPVRYTQDTSQ